MIPTYLLFAGTVSRNELACAFAVGALVAGWSWRFRRYSPHFAWQGGVLRAVVSAVRDLVPGTLRAGAGLFCALAAGNRPGRSRTCRFVHGPRNDPAERTRRAVAVLTASVAPNRFVVVPDRGGHEVLLHELGPLGRPPDERWLQ